ncbi:MAG TPA: Flp family type IVb pilin [Propylenella sp.]
MQRLLTRYRDDEDGATAVEYGLVVTLIAVAIITAIAAIGLNLKSMAEGIGEAIGNAGR